MIKSIGLLDMEQFIALQGQDIPEPKRPVPLKLFSQHSETVLMDGLMDFFENYRLYCVNGEYIAKCGDTWLSTAGIIDAPTIQLEELDFNNDRPRATCVFKDLRCREFDGIDGMLDRASMKCRPHYCDIYDDYAKYVAKQFLRTLRLPPELKEMCG